MVYIKNIEDNFTENKHSVNQGIVYKTYDGVAVITGLRNVQAGEFVVFEGGLKGLVLNLESDVVKVLIIGSDFLVSENIKVVTTGFLARTPVGLFLLGKVLDPIGTVLDGRLTDFENVVYKDNDIKAPGILSYVRELLHTGLNAILLFLMYNKK
jgi:F-type H+-transporting ATPase subunit alpha